MARALSLLRHLVTKASDLTQKQVDAGLLQAGYRTDNAPLTEEETTLLLQLAEALLLKDETGWQYSLLHLVSKEVRRPLVERVLLPRAERRMSEIEGGPYTNDITSILWVAEDLGDQSLIVRVYHALLRWGETSRALDLGDKHAIPRVASAIRASIEIVAAKKKKTLLDPEIIKLIIRVKDESLFKALLKEISQRFLKHSRARETQSTDSGAAKAYLKAAVPWSVRTKRLKRMILEDALIKAREQIPTSALHPSNVQTLLEGSGLLGRTRRKRVQRSTLRRLGFWALSGANGNDGGLWIKVAFQCFKKARHTPGLRAVTRAWISRGELREAERHDLLRELRNPSAGLQKLARATARARIEANGFVGEDFLFFGGDWSSLHDAFTKSHLDDRLDGRFRFLKRLFGNPRLPSLWRRRFLELLRKDHDLAWVQRYDPDAVFTDADVDAAIAYHLGLPNHGLRSSAYAHHLLEHRASYTKPRAKSRT